MAAPALAGAMLMSPGQARADPQGQCGCTTQVDPRVQAAQAEFDKAYKANKATWVKARADLYNEFNKTQQTPADWTAYKQKGFELDEARKAADNAAQEKLKPIMNKYFYHREGCKKSGQLDKKVQTLVDEMHDDDIPDVDINEMVKSKYPEVAAKVLKKSKE